MSGVKHVAVFVVSFVFYLSLFYNAIPEFSEMKAKAVMDEHEQQLKRLNEGHQLVTLFMLDLLNYYNVSNAIHNRNDEAIFEVKKRLANEEPFKLQLLEQIETDFAKNEPEWKEQEEKYAKVYAGEKSVLSIFEAEEEEEIKVRDINVRRNEVYAKMSMELIKYGDMLDTYTDAFEELKEKAIPVLGFDFTQSKLASDINAKIDSISSKLDRIHQLKAKSSVTPVTNTTSTE